MKDTALIVVDMLYDFIDGSLACRNAENAVRETVRFIDSNTQGKGDDAEITGQFPVIFIRDHHPADHMSFKENGGIWPAHCIQGTRGGQFHKDLEPYAVNELTFDKGCDASKEQYSGFEGLNPAGQSLDEVLDLLDIHEVYVCGIATEFCVRNTCEDLCKAGYKVHVLKDCLGWVEDEGHRKALEEMRTHMDII